MFTDGTDCLGFGEESLCILAYFVCNIKKYIYIYILQAEQKQIDVTFSEEAQIKKAVP